MALRSEGVSNDNPLVPGRQRGASDLQESSSSETEQLSWFLRQVNARERSDYRVVRRFTGPVNSGALLVEGARGRRIVKWLRSAGALEAQYNARLVTQTLRPRGYPAPTYEQIDVLPDGSGYVVMDVLPGDKADFRREGVAQAKAVIALNQLQDGVSVLPTNWPQSLIDGVARGGDSYCFPEVMGAGAQTRSLLAALQRLSLDQVDAPVMTGIVHKDMNPGNILATNAAITGVVDWENTCAGDPAYDLVYLWFCIYAHEHCRPVLWSHLKTTNDPRTIALYAAHVILGFVSGSLKRHDNEYASKRIAAAKLALADIRHLGVEVVDVHG